MPFIASDDEPREAIAKPANAIVENDVIFRQTSLPDLQGTRNAPFSRTGSMSYGRRGSGNQSAEDNTIVVGGVVGRPRYRRLLG
jgi:hypothetical protein